MEIGTRREERGTLRDLLNDPKFVQELVDNYTPDPNDMAVFLKVQRSVGNGIARIKTKPYCEQQMKKLKERESDLAELKKAQTEWIRAAAVLDYLDRTDPNKPADSEEN
ncbi:MAG: hypothetical protein OXT69_00515 [Candidatus Poribacteria bacterium]|nr:hypothetical protein [Candidatus Poribacteria bacterium]MDE0019852.1 hypothetical protein [Candidatus Poribacteria bacterium]